MTYSYYASAPKSVLPLLLEEIKLLGGVELREAPSGVYYKGDLELGYRSCLWSRTANRIYLQLGEFSVADEEALYQAIGSIDWAQHMDPECSFAVSCTCTLSKIQNSQFAMYKIKDAIVDQFRSRTELRPDVRTTQPDIKINVHIFRNKALVSLDLSGESLHHRAYLAPSLSSQPSLSSKGIPANLIAAMLLRAQLPQTTDNSSPVIAPFCTDGVLPIEAAYIMSNTAPALSRDYFGFSQWRQHQEPLWLKLLEKAEQAHREGLSNLPEIKIFTRSKHQFQSIFSQIKAAGLDDNIAIYDDEQLEKHLSSEPSSGLLLAIFNHPKNNQHAEQNVNQQQILHQQCQSNLENWEVTLITDETNVSQNIGYHPYKTHRFSNRQSEYSVLRYKINAKSIYKGSGSTIVALPPERWTVGGTGFANRLKKNDKQLRRWINKEAICCYRLYDADLPEYAFAIDLYQIDEESKTWAVIQEYDPPKTINPQDARKRRKEALGILAHYLDIPAEYIILKTRRRQKGKEQYEKAEDQGVFHIVREGKAKFLVNFTDYLDTGLFLDHRITRELISSLAKEKDFLNLFAYTGAATVHAALGGAKTTTTVDMSRTYIDWAKKNLALNDLDSPYRHRFIQADCIAWLQNADHYQQYDLVFLDPPTFSSSKRMDNKFDIQTDHVSLIKDTFKLIRPGGSLIFSNNFRKFKLNLDSLAMFSIKELTSQTMSPDFKRKQMHSCWLINEGA